MKKQNLKTRILLSFFLVLSVAGISAAVLGCYVIQRDIIGRAQMQVKNDLKAASLVYQGELDRIKSACDLVFESGQAAALKDAMGLDYVEVIPAGDASKIKGEIAAAALKGKAVVGTRLIAKDELLGMGRGFYELARMAILATPKARPSAKQTLETAMALEYARPVYDAAGRVQSVMVAGKLINRDFELVDKIRDLVFENKLYGGKPLGTVTIFQDDVRIATNVLDEKGNRAIGTRISEAVYRKVVEQGESWIKRAFVVTDWYLTGYEPIRDINGRIIGVLYVGLLEQPYVDMARNIFLVFLAIVLFSGILAVVLRFFLATSITRPVEDMMGAAEKIAAGDLGSRVRAETSIREFDSLAASFNKMAQKLDEREKALKIVNERLSALNTTYVDLVCFVSHELKAIISSLVLNAHIVKDGFLGEVNEKQKKALEAITSPLDYLAATVRNFLDLGRIEKGELALCKSRFCLKEDVFDGSIEVFLKQAAKKDMRISNMLDPALAIEGDVDLMRIVANNLIGNAVKFGQAQGCITVSCRKAGDHLEVEIYNDGCPIPAREHDKLFKKFSKIETPGTEAAQGTGLGLFIVKEIVNKHNGRIWLETRAAGNAFIFQIERGKQNDTDGNT